MGGQGRKPSDDEGTRDEQDGYSQGEEDSGTHAHLVVSPGAAAPFSPTDSRVGHSPLGGGARGLARTVGACRSVK